MRFAGAKVEDFFGSNRPDMGKLSQKAAISRSDENSLVTGLEGQLEEAQLGADAKVKSAKLTGAGQAALGSGQAWGQAFSSIGSSIAGGIGNINSTATGNYFGSTPKDGYQGFGTSKYGSFQDPTADINRAGITNFGIHG